MHSHTSLVNKTLGLGTPDVRGNSSLFLDHGYRAYAIEKSVHVGDRIVVPDVIFLNEETGHLLVVDCKSGANINTDQDQRYSLMCLNDIIRTTRPECAVHSHTFAYAINEMRHERIRSHTNAALIIFGHNSVRGDGDLGNSRLTRLLLEGVALEETPYPRFTAYPFSVHDRHADIDGHVEIGLSLYVGERGLARKPPANNAVALEILRIVHPYHSIFGSSHRDELVGVIRESLARTFAASG